MTAKSPLLEQPNDLRSRGAVVRGSRLRGCVSRAAFVIAWAAAACGPAATEVRTEDPNPGRAAAVPEPPSAADGPEHGPPPPVARVITHAAIAAGGADVFAVTHSMRVYSDGRSADGYAAHVYRLGEDTWSPVAPSLSFEQPVRLDLVAPSGAPMVVELDSASRPRELWRWSSDPGWTPLGLADVRGGPTLVAAVGGEEDLVAVHSTTSALPTGRIAHETFVSLSRWQDGALTPLCRGSVARGPLRRVEAADVSLQADAHRIALALCTSGVVGDVHGLTDCTVSVAAIRGRRLVPLPVVGRSYQGSPAPRVSSAGGNDRVAFVDRDTRVVVRRLEGRRWMDEPPVPSESSELPGCHAVPLSLYGEPPTLVLGECERDGPSVFSYLRVLSLGQDGWTEVWPRWAVPEGLQMGQVVRDGDDLVVMAWGVRGMPRDGSAFALVRGTAQGWAPLPALPVPPP